MPPYSNVKELPVGEVCMPEREKRLLLEQLFYKTVHFFCIYLQKQWLRSLENKVNTEKEMRGT